MKQRTFSDVEYSGRARTTTRKGFLDIMNDIIPWEEWIAVIQPHYFDGRRGRPPMRIEKKMRMYLLQAWFSLSDEGVEGAIYASYAIRKFMGINFTNEKALDATTLLHFRKLLEDNRLGRAMFEAINHALEGVGQIMRGGSVMDATIINAPSSTKNEKKERDPEMHQVKKGNE